MLTLHLSCGDWGKHNMCRDKQHKPPTATNWFLHESLVSDTESKHREKQPRHFVLSVHATKCDVKSHFKFWQIHISLLLAPCSQSAAPALQSTTKDLLCPGSLQVSASIRSSKQHLNNFNSLPCMLRYFLLLLQHSFGVNSAQISSKDLNKKLMFAKLSGKHVSST